VRIIARAIAQEEGGVQKIRGGVPQTEGTGREITPVGKSKKLKANTRAVGRNEESSLRRHQRKGEGNELRAVASARFSRRTVCSRIEDSSPLLLFGV
jgi:hypothetical protein